MERLPVFMKLKIEMTIPKTGELIPAGEKVKVVAEDSLYDTFRINWRGHGLTIMRGHLEEYSEDEV